eukprot:gnl/TRDRNA2_/TRDRNA2_184854_c0_seq1.p1 gnl/TRDRNA2_/TRDRNA2_184854_c0~~gnl/TRDRNA2_/TRDRNA2_184854_c0_seq1.p1  ORF type:complete len:296 (-),score=60.50 gnl/TRDRNA2_/TRDRNA2_184854_c0_seq1:75-962(-)
MGGITQKCGGPKHFESTNQKVPEEINFYGHKDVHAVIVYVDYGFEPAKSAGWCPAGFGDKLDTFENAMMITKLLEDCHITSYKTICNTMATKASVLALIDEVGARCDDDDIFFFYYSGHGAPMPDQDGDEEDGQDEAICLPYANGGCDQGSWLRDDDLAAAIANVHTGQKLMIFDCCHSGSMMDFNKKFQWENQSAVALCGCRDAQESAGMGGGTRGGAFTKCIKDAVHSLGSEEYSVGKLFNTALDYKSTYVPYNHQQDMSISTPEGMDPSNMPWPFVLPNEEGKIIKRGLRRK